MIDEIRESFGERGLAGEAADRVLGGRERHPELLVLLVEMDERGTASVRRFDRLQVTAEARDLIVRLLELGLELLGLAPVLVRDVDQPFEGGVVAVLRARDVPHALEQPFQLLALGLLLRELLGKEQEVRFGCLQCLPALAIALGEVPGRAQTDELAFERRAPLALEREETAELARLLLLDGAVQREIDVLPVRPAPRGLELLLEALARRAQRADLALVLGGRLGELGRFERLLLELPFELGDPAWIPASDPPGARDSCASCVLSWVASERSSSRM